MVGDLILSVDGRDVLDQLDFTYLTAEDSVVISVERDSEIISLEVGREEGEELGIEFAEELFDGLHKCANNCVFCFLKQMPGGMRESLNQRDDDYRLSFAHGNYITLSNVTDAEMERICAQRMSPLYISVHTTDPALRERMLGNHRAGQIMDQLRRLAQSRITLQCQVVLVPGFNDGDHLERTVSDLASLYPAVESIAIVPVGLTKHREGLARLRRPSAEEAGDVTAAVRKWAIEFKRTLGTRLVYASDEFYVLAGRDFPGRTAYEGFAQLEDGVGVCRLFLDELKRLERKCGRSSIQPGQYMLVTGELAAPLVRQLADTMSRIDGVGAEVLAVENEFFGEFVTVAGLLVGKDVARALKTLDGLQTVLIPDIMLKDDRFLDDMTVDDLREKTSASVVVVPSSPIELWKQLAVSTGSGV